MDDDRAIVAHHGFGYAETLDLKLSAPLAAVASHARGSSPRRSANKGAMLQEAESRLKALFVRGLDGDADAYRSFLQALTRHLRAFLRRRIPHYRDDVEDLVQEILLAVHNARHTYRQEQPLTAWVHAIARYKLMDFFRAHSRREALHEPFDDDGGLFVASDAEPADARRDVGQLLEALPDRHRLPIVLVKLQGLSVAEAAQRSGMSESAVKVGVHRGLKALSALIRGLR